MMAGKVIGIAPIASFATLLHNNLSESSKFSVEITNGREESTTPIDASSIY